MPSNITPAINETTSPYQFDGTVLMGGANASLAMSPVQPGDFALKAWNFPTYLAQGTATWLPLGSVMLSAVHLNYGITYSNILLNLISGKGSAGVGSNFVGIYNAAGTLVATSNDVSTQLGTGAPGTASGICAFPLATAYTPTAGGIYYVAVEFNCLNTSSIPILWGLTGQTAATSASGVFAGTVGFTALSTSTVAGTAAPYPWAAIATTSATALPGTFALGSAGTTGAQVFWCGLS